MPVALPGPLHHSFIQASQHRYEVETTVPFYRQGRVKTQKGLMMAFVPGLPPFKTPILSTIAQCLPPDKSQNIPPPLKCQDETVFVRYRHSLAHTSELTLREVGERLSGRLTLSLETCCFQGDGTVESEDLQEEGEGG